MSPQTLSIAEDCPHNGAATAFINFLHQPRNMVRLDLGDRLLPTGRQELRDPALRAARYDWATGHRLGYDASAPHRSTKPQLRPPQAPFASLSTTSIAFM
ncbi:hypothetical protein [Streptomyces sioyaensis]|uniref:hypothetical protein n=1 Tax=Streptomyces sioyaensis TaxID=67364 RepID=UPI003F54148F